jgi:hypothetical protein
MKNKILLMAVVSSAVIGCQTGGEKPEEPVSSTTYSISQASIQLGPLQS